MQKLWWIIGASNKFDKFQVLVQNQNYNVFFWVNPNAQLAWGAHIASHLVWHMIDWVRRHEKELLPQHTYQGARPDETVRPTSVAPAGRVLISMVRRRWCWQNRGGARWWAASLVEHDEASGVGFGGRGVRRNPWRLSFHRRGDVRGRRLSFLQGVGRTPPTLSSSCWGKP
jgi:hypothetical protein